MLMSCRFCKKELNTSLLGLYSHQGHCQQYHNYKNIGLVKDRFGDSRGWMKGITKDDPRYEASMRFNKAGRDSQVENPLIKWSKNKPIEAYQRQSITRKLRYANGTLTPAAGVGTGKYSYFIYKDKTYLLRSTYEFIFALWLSFKNLNFDYESIRVQYENSTKFCDFVVNGKIIEIKGVFGSHTDVIINAFKNHGYKISVFTWRHLSRLRLTLIKNGYNVDDLIYKIIEGHTKCEYFKYVVPS